MPKISVVITAHNYGRYVRQAVDSVLAQAFADFELVVVDDGSTDNTADVLAVYADDPRVRVLSLEGVGLAAAANRGIRASSGEFVIRLDADDYFDENILLVLCNVLDRHPEYGMVYPDYYRVSKHGEILDQVRQPKVNDEVKLLDRSALAAGALFRRACFDAIGGYSEELRYQEDYDFWIRFVDRFHVCNVQLPLMYYRQHSASMSTNRKARMEARRYVKHKFATAHRDLLDKRVLCVLPMVMDNRYRHGLPLVEVGGRLLMSYVMDEASTVEMFDRVIVDTEDAHVAAEARRQGIEVPHLRPRELARLDVPTTEHLRHLVTTLEREENYRPDVIVVAAYNHPFITAAHMVEAAETLAVHSCDGVISVTPNLRFHWKPGEHGLQPITHPRDQLFDQKDLVFEERGGVVAFNVDNLRTHSFLGQRISFIEVDETEGLRVESPFTHWIADRVLAERAATSAVRDRAAQ